MRKFLLSLLMLAFLSPLALRADEIIVGTSDGTPSAVVPFRNNQTASYTQSIYPQAEIGGATTITAVAFNCATPTLTTNAKVKIYVGETDKTTHTNYSDWLENPTLVYEGEVTIGGEEWETFTFNAPYEYSGTKNLVIAVSSENTVNMNLKWNKFAEATAKPTLHNTSAGSEPSNVTSVKGYRPVIKLTTTGGGGTTPEPGEGDDDEEPTTLAAPVVAATALSSTEIKLEWEAVADTATYQIYIEDENIGTTKETSFIVVNCASETQVCCTVVAELGEVKSEASEPACATTLAEGEEPVNPVIPGVPTTVFIGEDGEFTSYYSPIYDYYSNYAVTQQIYTAEEIGIASGEITNIAFKSSKGGGYNRNISVYLSNTDKEYYSGNMDWVILTEADAAVFEGTVTTPTNGEWLTIELTTPFEYTGGNLAVTVNDKTGSYGSVSQFIEWEAYSTGKSETSQRALYATSWNTEIPYTGLAQRYGTFNNSGAPYNENINNKVKFTIIPSASNVEVPETVSLGKVLLADYWTEKTSTKVSVKAINTTISNITVDNDFFVLPSEIDYTANTVTFDLSYNRNAEVSGDVNGTITVTYAEGTKTFPVTATVYTPVQPDVFELAEEVVFTENAYTHTPEFANLNDNYVLPQEIVDGKAPDAVYAFELEADALISAKVTGTNAQLAMYKEDFEEQGGPSKYNAFSGISFTKKNFFYDFNDGTINGWRTIDEDGNGYNWEVTTVEDKTYLISYSYRMNADDVIKVANNVLVTEQAYNITANSKLSFDAFCYSHDFEAYKDHVRVEVSKDGENFTLIEKVLPEPVFFANEVVNIGAKFAELGLEYGDYYVALRHEENDKMYVCVDNVQLINENITRAPEKSISGVYYPAGKYYMVAAAEDAFSVELSYEVTTMTPPVDIFASATETSITLTWNPIANVDGYNVYFGEEKFTTTDTTYTFNDLEPFTEYSFIIKSYIGEEESFASEEVVVRTKDLTISVPTNFTARAASSSEILLTWNAVENATAYNVYSVDDAAIVIATVTEPTCTVTGLETAAYYCFAVTAVRNGSETERTEEACAETSDVMPSAPTNLVATTISETAIGLTWAAGENALTYNVYRGETLVGNTAALLYIDENLQAGTEYCYTVKGVRGETESAEASNEACAITDGVAPSAPVAPTYLQAEAIDTQSIKLTWTAVGNATSYKVYQGDENIATSELPYYTVTGLEYDTEYCFTVTALNEAGESEKSTQVCKKTLGEGIDELASLFNIYPNPVKDELFIATEVNVEEIAIYDVYGRQTMSQQVNVTASQQVVNVAGLNSGIYFVKIVTSEGEVVKRFVKK